MQSILSTARSNQRRYSVKKGVVGNLAKFTKEATIPVRNSHQSCSIKKGALKSFIKFTGKQLWQSLFLNKVAGLSPANLFKKSLWRRCFPMNFAKFLRTPFL